LRAGRARRFSGEAGSNVWKSIRERDASCARGGRTRAASHENTAEGGVTCGDRGWIIGIRVQRSSRRLVRRGARVVRRCVASMAHPRGAFPWRALLPVCTPCQRLARCFRYLYEPGHPCQLRDARSAHHGRATATRATSNLDALQPSHDSLLVTGWSAAGKCYCKRMRVNMVPTRSRGHAVNCTQDLRSHKGIAVSVAAFSVIHGRDRAWKSRISRVC
jgi:hypothetical protein